MKSKSTAMWLALLVGGLGAHKFYLGESGKGWLYLVFCWTYIPGLAGLVEGIGLARMSEQDFNQKYNPQAAVAYTSAPAPAQTQQGANGAPEAANPPLVRRGLLLALTGMVFFFFVFVALSPSKPSSDGRNPAASAQPSEQAAGAAARPKGDLVPVETIEFEPGAAEGKPAEPLDGSPAGQAWRRLAEASLPGETPYDQLERWCKANIKPKFPNFRDFDLCTPDMPWWSAPQDFQTPGSNSLEVRDNENKRADIAAAWAQAPIVLLTEDFGASLRSKGYNEKTSTFSLTFSGHGFGDALSFKPISVKGSGISIGKYSAIDHMNRFEVHVPCNEDVARKLYKVLEVDAFCEHGDHGCQTSGVVWKVIGKVESIGFLGKDCSQGMYGDCLKTFGPVIKPLGVRVSLKGGGKEVFLEKDSVQDISPGTVLFQWISPDAPL